MPFYNSQKSSLNICVPAWPAYDTFEVGLNYQDISSVMEHLLVSSNYNLIISLIGNINYPSGSVDSFTVSKYLFVNDKKQIDNAVKMFIDNASMMEMQYTNDTIVGDRSYILRFSKSTLVMSGFSPIPFWKDLIINYKKGFTFINNHIKQPNNIDISQWLDWHFIDDFWVFDNVRCKSSINIVDGLNVYTRLITYNDSIISVIDSQISDITFIREFDNKKYIITNGRITSCEVLKKNPILTTLHSTASFNVENIYTLDIECLLVSGEFIPYMVGLYDGRSYSYEYGLNCINVMQSRIKNKGKPMNIYVHNLDKFDSRFLLKSILLLGYDLHVTPGSGSRSSITSFEILSRKGKKKISIKFLDSYKILPSSLGSLGKSFGLPISKLAFPYTFMNNVDKLNYIGDKPLYSYYKNMSIEVYNKIPNLWNAHKESILYNRNDCIVLYDVLLLFLTGLNNEYGQDVLKKGTLPSKAISVFRTMFYDIVKYPIFKLNKNIDRDIRKSYYGGVVDVYKTVQHNGYYYDVNSLYPYAMTMPKPIGQARSVKGIIDLNTFFGFLYVNVEAPLDMNIPFLPKKINSGLVNPVGTWKGWYFSEELKHAIKLGYKITLLNEGYAFDKGQPFDDFVNHFYKIKSSTNDLVQKMISKLILNALYGKFGQDNSNNTSMCVLSSKDSLSRICKGNALYTVIDFVNDKGLFSVDDDKSTSFSNVAIASAITAYGRIIMDSYKRIPDNECYYTDTDSVFLAKPLGEDYIGNNQGKKKLESVIKEAIFISPKVYGYYNHFKTEVKIKGFTSDKVSLNELKLLLNIDNTISIESEYFKRKGASIEQVKTYKVLANTVRNKRIPVFKNGLVTSTKPLIISE